MCLFAIDTGICQLDVLGQGPRPDDRSHGNLYMSLSAVWSYKQLCSVHTDINGVAATTCKALYAQLLAAEGLDRDITFWFDKDGVTTEDCSPTRFPAWTYLSTTGSSGWYFGPRMVD